MKIKFDVERVRAALDDPEHSGLSDEELAVLTACVELAGENEKDVTKPVKKVRKPRPTRIKKGKRN